jgi:hypothetical protein
MQIQLTRCFYLRCHVGEFEGNCLVVADRATECDTLVGITPRRA